MYRLFNRIPKGLDPVADIFKKHVEGEGMALVKEVTEAAQMRKEKDSGKHTRSSSGCCSTPNASLPQSKCVVGEQASKERARLADPTSRCMYAKSLSSTTNTWR
eukprot:scaffold309737_cov46-Prasinocladus_malaysianus.AAC.1